VTGSTAGAERDGNGSPIRIVVSGATGRMGRTVTRLAEREPSIQLVGGLDRETAPDLPVGVAPIVTIAEAEGVLRSCDVVIDFSAPAFLRVLLQDRLETLTGSALVVGTTGLGPEVETLLERAAERIPVLTAANFSIGVNLLLALAERTAAVLDTEFDVEIVETHHRRKEDAPSGTALALGAAVAAGRKTDLESVRRDGRSGRPGARPTGEIGMHALRGGDVIGDHVVHFIGEVERVELAHRASDRSLFASGALRAARWIARRTPGRYSMKDVLGF
jgi:4-hydroxy-tetrahydrodipicolinate reductase